MAHTLVWFDMEMTGLDPESCVPVEVACVITDDKLNEKGHFESVIWQPDSVLERMNPFVREMHTSNGLLDKIRAARNDCGAVEKFLLNFIATRVKFGTGVLAGSSIHHDRRFLAKYFPAIHGYLHYRMVDVSTIKELVSRWAPNREFNKPASDHTALSDARASIAELAYYQREFFS